MSTSGATNAYPVAGFFVIASMSSMCGSSAVTLSSGAPTISWNPSPFHAFTARWVNSASDFTNPSSRNTGANRGHDRSSSPSRKRSAAPTMNATSSWDSPPDFPPSAECVERTRPSVS